MNMTRDFNQQRRDNVRSSSRPQSSNRYGEERSPRPARPRLNRETVDRGWESGARHDHADYRTRNNNGQPPRFNGQRRAYTERPSAPNTRRPFENNYQSTERTHRDSERPSAPNARRPFENNYQRTEQTHRDSNGYQGPRSRPFNSHNSQPRRFDERHPGERRSYSARPNETGPRSDFRENTHFRDQRPPFRGGEREQNRGYERRSFDRNQRDFEQGTRSPRDRNVPQRDSQHPRWQSRPTAQKHEQNQGRRDFNRSERFEGDYEGMETDKAPQRFPNRLVQDQERHVTELPDGRVLKGPRPVQRKDAEFWTEVSEDTHALIEKVEASTATPKANPTNPDKPVVPRKPRTRPKGIPTPGKKLRGMGKSAPKPRSTGPKPSKHGFKWPKPEA